MDRPSQRTACNCATNSANHTTDNCAHRGTNWAAYERPDNSPGLATCDGAGSGSCPSATNIGSGACCVCPYGSAILPIGTGKPIGINGDRGGNSNTSSAAQHAIDIGGTTQNLKRTTRRAGLSSACHTPICLCRDPGHPLCPVLQTRGCVAQWRTHQIVMNTASAGDVCPQLTPIDITTDLILKEHPAQTVISAACTHRAHLETGLRNRTCAAGRKPTALRSRHIAISRRVAHRAAIGGHPVARIPLTRRPIVSAVPSIWAGAAPILARPHKRILRVAVGKACRIARRTRLAGLARRLDQANPRGTGLNALCGSHAGGIVLRRARAGWKGPSRRGPPGCAGLH